MEGLHITISPPRVELPFLGSVSQTVVVTWMVLAVLIIFGLIFRFVLVKRFKDVPKGFQAVVELYAEFIMKFTRDKIGKFGKGLEAYMFVLPLFIALSGFTELFGFRPPIADLTMTATMAIITFVLINYYGVKAKGGWGRVKSFGALLPIRLLTEIAVPVSLACRLFGNMLGGMIVMQIIYAIIPIIVPGVLGLYFNLFHVLIQTYIFITLTLSFISEAVE